MQKANMKNSVLVGLAALAILLTGGCMRKHIVSSPPSQKQNTTAAATPATKPEKSKPEIIEETHVIEETYVVDAPDDGTEPVVIHEGELMEEEVAIAPASNEETATEETQAEKKTVDEAATKAEQEPDQPVLGEMYYIQVGAFSDLENANKVLAGLIRDGYKGSRLAKTDDGLYRVQAGAFTDEPSAGEALVKLLPDYPKGFILKERAAE